MRGFSREGTHKQLWALFACVGVYGITHSMLTPLLSIILEQRRVGADLIGLLAAMPAIGMLLISPWVPKMIKCFGMRRFLLVCLLIDGAMVALLLFVDWLPAWMLMRLAMGASVAGLFIASETWINEIAMESHRGRLMGLYNALMYAAFAVGPFLPTTVGADSQAFVAAVVMLSLLIVPLYRIGASAPTLGGGESFSSLSFIRVAPILSGAIVLFAFYEFTKFGLLPVYGVRIGLDTNSAMLTISVISLGGLCAQVPIGWLADRLDRRKMLWWCGVGALLGAGCLPLVNADSPALWLSLFLWGGIFSGIYTLVMTVIGEEFRGTDLANANAASGILWGLASLVGPSVGGYAMKLWDPHGFPVTLMVAGLIFILGAKPLIIPVAGRRVL